MQFYVDLVREHGEAGAPQAGFTECLNNMIQGNAAMWYDATSAAGSLEAADSPVRGQDRLRAAPVVETDSSGWLYAWSWGIQEASKKKDAAWKFISWASGKDYEQLVGEQVGWSNVPAGQAGVDLREPGVPRRGQAFAEQTQAAIEAPTRTTPACSRGPRSASSSSASRSSPTSAPRCRRRSARRSPG